jgi:hypothetical protein
VGGLDQIPHGQSRRQSCCECGAKDPRRQLCQHEELLDSSSRIAVPPGDRLNGITGAEQVGTEGEGLTDGQNQLRVGMGSATSMTRQKEVVAVG